MSFKYLTMVFLRILTWRTRKVRRHLPSPLPTRHPSTINQADHLYRPPFLEFDSCQAMFTSLHSESRTVVTLPPVTQWPNIEGTCSIRAAELVANESITNTMMWANA